MARIIGKFIKGKVSNVVYKKYRNKQIVQKVPEFTAASHTEASKKAATTFGQASILASNFRDNMNSIITNFVDGEMVNRLNSEVIHIFNQCIDQITRQFTFLSDSFSRLNGFEFNTKSMVRNIFHAQPALEARETRLKIHIPEIQLPRELIFPNGIGHCLLSFGLGIYDLKNGRCSFCPVQTKELEYRFEPGILPPADFEFEIEPGCLCITIISLQFLKNTFAGRMFYNTRDYNPTAILNAFIAEGAVDKKNTNTWKEMDFKIA